MKTSLSTTARPASVSVNQRIRGQGLTEYVIILSLVAIAAIGATSFFGDTVKAGFVALGTELTGGARYDMLTETKASLTKAEGAVRTQTTLKNYRD